MTPEQREQWAWDMDAQRYQHKPCEAISDPEKRTCEKCGDKDPSYFTFGDVLDFVIANELDQDEYFVLDSQQDANRQVYGPDIRWAVSFFVEGSSEGWYVHVEQISRDGQRWLRMLGKFWSIEAAERASNMIARYLQNRNWA